MGPDLPRNQLSQVRVVDRSAHRHRARVDPGADDPRARYMAALESHPPRACRRDGVVSDRHHADAVVSGVHVRPVAGGDPDSRWPADAENHRHHSAAQQRRSLQRRIVRVHAGVRRRRAQPAGRERARAGRDGHRGARCRMHRRLPVPDRLRRAAAATGRCRRQRRGRGHDNDRCRLSGTGDGAAAGGSCAARDARHAHPRGRTPWQIGNRARRRHPHAGGAGAAPRRRDRDTAAGGGFRRRRRAV